MGALRPWHIAIFVAVLVLLFGAKRPPDAARSLGRSLRIKAETGNLVDDNDNLAESADHHSRQPLSADAGRQPGQATYQPPGGRQSAPPQQPPAQPFVDLVPRSNGN